MNTKTCPRCSRTLDVADFNWRNRARGRLQPYCRTCSRAYIRDHYRQNKAYYVDKAHTRNLSERAEIRRRLLLYLLAHPCVDCGDQDPVVLQFDHSDPILKTAEIGVLFRRGVSWRRIKAEIDKCLVRCANCHQRRTARQFGWYRLEAAALAPVAQLDRASVFGTEGLQVRSLSGAPLYRRECHGALWRSAYDLINAQGVAFALMATCLAVALALW